MSIGSSGRIVIEVEPEIKKQLYAVLAREGLTLKDWFLSNTRYYLMEENQLSLPLFSVGSLRHNQS
jgi:hypothetical protein